MMKIAEMEQRQMSKQDDGQAPRAKYTLEFKLEAVRLVKAGRRASVTAQGAGHAEADAGQLGAG
jgi:transposase-like protein